MKVFGMCINKKVVAGLAVVGLGVWWLAPGAIGAALPFLLIAICPLSMLVMMKAMNGMNGPQHGQQANGEPARQAPPAEPVAEAPAAHQLSLPVAAGDPADTAPVR